MITWKDIRERLKDEDRYYQAYPEKAESFWFTLDSKIVAWTMNRPTILGLPLRILYALLLLSNRYEPMPIGNREHVTNLWKDKSTWMRYFLWKIRNPWEDLRKFYIGFGTTDDVITKRITKRFMIHFAKFDWCPFRLPFPYYKDEGDILDIMIGWKFRGIPSITIRASD